ncbi:MAG: hypothetical protein ACI8PW_001989 [Methylophilaceae bacterium]|jgi:hypothetical protein
MLILSNENSINDNDYHSQCKALFVLLLFKFNYVDNSTAFTLENIALILSLVKPLILFQ